MTSRFKVGNAPCSWGTLEFESAQCEQIPFDRMLDELRDTGYTGTELGDWGYMPTDAAALRGELQRRDLVMLGAFVPVSLRDSAAHAPGVATAVKTARLLAAVATQPAPYLVLADNNGTDAVRTRLAGRVPADAGLSAQEWTTFARGAEQIARSVLEETGIRTVFHHHCAGFVERPEEIARLLEMTDPKLLGLVFDTGHYTYGSGTTEADVRDGLRRFADRIWYLHLKDCDPRVARSAREQEWDYFTALRHGVFCELGKGQVDFRAVFEWIREHHYEGYVLVEQDVLPGMGSPAESARRNREYLRSLEPVFAQTAAEGAK
ncbi:MAG: TIM barrel protein [Acidobacteriota bacterium]